jgi:hypothetical protein
MGPATIAALQQLLQDSVDRPGRHADRRDGRRHRRPPLRRPPAKMATEAGVRFDAILPPDGLNDWNDALRAMTPAP